MTYIVQTKSSPRRPSAMLAVGAALTAVFLLGAIAPSARADDRHDDHRGDGRGYGWGDGGYYPAPPVVYGSPYYAPYYVAPPVVYGPAVGIELPGVNIRLR
jgi:hypothetical protein